MINFLKHFIFYAILTITTTILALLTPILILIPYKIRYYIVAITWESIALTSIRLLFNLDFKISGLENLPSNTHTAIVVSNHESIWETIAFMSFLPMQTWVVKKELLRVPFYGWLIWMCNCIPIDRSKAGSLNQIIEKSKTIIEKYGTWIVIFPQGTRVLPGQKKRYKKGAAVLANHYNCPVVPIAHNSGDFWPKGLWVKKSGIVDVKIGKFISPKDKTVDELHNEIESWIETNSAELHKVGYSHNNDLHNSSI